MTAQFELGATIPIGPYANAQPRITTTGADFISARDEAFREMQHIVAALNPDLAFNAPQGPVTGPQLPSTATTQVCVVSGTEVMFDPVTHTYGPGTWLSGSAFAKKFQPAFPADIIAHKIAAKYGVSASDVLAWWSKNSEIATTYGSSIHAGIEAYGKYRELADVTKGDPDAALPKNPHIRDAVVKFFELHGEQPAMYEAFVADAGLKHCGFIDRLVYPDGKTSVVIDDMKTNFDLHREAKIKPPFAGKVPNTTLGGYWLQLSFYASILQRHGITVDGLTVSHWDGSGWTVFEHEVVDVSEAF